jgi:tetratricopeptide (TPR) repeat protein
MYDNIMNKFKWGGVTDPDVYLDENNRRMISNFRNSFSQLALALIEEEKPDSAKEVLDHCLEIMPHRRIPFNYWAIFLAEAYYRINESDKANTIVEKLASRYTQELDYYFSLKSEFSSALDTEKQMALHIMQELVRLTRTYGQPEINKPLEEKFREFITLYTSS